MAKFTNIQNKVPLNFEGYPLRLATREKIEILKIIRELNQVMKRLPKWLQQELKNL